jgi:hypothetical protein
VPTPANGKCKCAAGYGRPPFPKPPKGATPAHGSKGKGKGNSKKPAACELCPQGSVSPSGSDKCAYCPTGQQPNDDSSACVPVCAPQTCDDLGFECGEQSDGCGGTLECGDCRTDETCSPLGTCEPNVVVSCGDGEEPDPTNTFCVCTTGWFGSGGLPPCTECVGFESSPQVSNTTGPGQSSCICQITGQTWVSLRGVVQPEKVERRG